MKYKKYNKFMIFFIIITFVILLSGCNPEVTPSQNEDKEIKEQSDSEYIMSTMVEMKVYGEEEEAEEVIEDSFARMREIENNMTRTQKDSVISEINDKSGKEAVEVDDSILEVLKTSIEYAEMTEGKFDPTIGPLVSLWGIGTEDARVPEQEEIDEARELVNYKWLEIDEKKNLVELTKEDMEIDLGAIAKGYAADEVKNIVEESSIESAFVNIGGNVMVIGSKTDGSDWKIGIQDPRIERGNVMGSINLKNKTVVTSGNYERYFEEDDKIYHHILDPDTGRPARNNLLGVSIVTENSMKADAISTSVFLMGLKDGREFVENMEGVEALFITEEEKVVLTSGLKGRFDIMNKDFSLDK